MCDNAQGPTFHLTAGNQEFSLAEMLSNFSRMVLASHLTCYRLRLLKIPVVLLISSWQIPAKLHDYDKDLSLPDISHSTFHS
jgi:hypothetical protein